MDKNKATCIVKVYKMEYEQNLERNLGILVKRMKNESYRPNSTRCIYIPKETNGKMRPLGYSAMKIKCNSTNT